MKYLLKNKIFNRNIIIFLFFIFLIIFRLHNADVFNSYWGYDGGAHLNYIEEVYKTNNLPDMQENYLAWHEPYFYVSYAMIGHVLDYFAGKEGYDFYEYIVKFWQILSAFVSILIIYLIYKISKFFTKNKYAQLAAVISSGLLSVITETTNYITNELLLAFFIILLFYYFIIFSRKGWNIKRILIISILSGIALLIKLSALIFIFAILIWLTYRSIYSATAAKGGGAVRWLGYAFIFLVIIILIYLPWGIYKQKNIGDLLFINIYEKNLAQNNKLNSDFFYRLNPQIFSNPFWLTSNNSFWTIIFADTFSDYYSISNNIDRNIFLPEKDKILVGSGNFVTHTKYRLSILLLYFSVFYIFIFLGGIIGLFWQWIRNSLKPSINLLILIFIIGSFMALMYNVWSFPFLERGTLKASFVLSIWPILMITGWSWLTDILNKLKLNFLWIVIYFFILIWGSLSVVINYI